MFERSEFAKILDKQGNLTLELKKRERVSEDAQNQHILYIAKNYFAEIQSLKAAVFFTEELSIIER
ncbi:MAG TPA: hypothetical protein DD429_09450 [Clostridiaceae bacterium]|nr:hypothetical protein [Clostridiaceae bacterium]